MQYCFLGICSVQGEDLLPHQEEKDYFAIFTVKENNKICRFNYDPAGNLKSEILPITREATLEDFCQHSSGWRLPSCWVRRCGLRVSDWCKQSLIYRDLLGFCVGEKSPWISVAAIWYVNNYYNEATKNFKESLLNSPDSYIRITRIIIRRVVINVWRKFSYNSQL